MSMPNRKRRDEIRREIDQYPHDYEVDVDELRAILDALDRRTAIIVEAESLVAECGNFGLARRIRAELEQDDD